MKKLVKKIPEIRNEFVYGKKSIFDSEGTVIGLSEEDSPFCKGAINNGFSEELALEIFSIMEEFAKYSFNKSHSAAYAFLAYRTAWLSYYYPNEWYCACLTIDSYDGNSKDLLIETINSAKRSGLTILTPNINISKKDFSVIEDENGKSIVFGLSGIPRVGPKVIDAIMYTREKTGPFKDFVDFLNRIYCNNEDIKEYIESIDGKWRNPVNKSHIENMIKVGVFDSFEKNRYKLLNILYGYTELTATKKKKVTSIENIEASNQYDENSFTLKEKLSLEYDTIGMYISQHPLDNEEVFPYVNVNQVKDGKNIDISGIFKSMTKSTTKKGKVYYKMKIETKDGSNINVTIFDNVYNKCPNIFTGLSGKKAKDGKEIIIASGRWNHSFGLTATNISRVIPSGDNEDNNSLYPETSEGINDILKDAPSYEGGDIFEEL